MKSYELFILFFLAGILIIIASELSRLAPSQLHLNCVRGLMLRTFSAVSTHCPVQIVS